MSAEEEMETPLHAIDQLIHRVGYANLTWWKDPATGDMIDRNTGEMLALVHSEISEALEGHRKNLMDDKLPQYRMFDVELVDAVIRIFDIAFHRCPNFGRIFEDKMAYNAQRADHKPENRLKEGGKKY